MGDPEVQGTPRCRGPGGFRPLVRLWSKDWAWQLLGVLEKVGKENGELRA